MVKPSRWSYRAGKMWFRGNSYEVCRHRIAKLATEMNAEKVPFTLLIGQRRNWLGKIDRHTWIEYDNNGTIEQLEPSRSGSNPRKKYTVTNIYRMNQGIEGEDYIGEMFIKKWANERV